ncbi:MAG TPA: hypothetical protein ENJ33_09030 [Thiothrix sp.]|nr:hypothetical protein [Thiothrix sp.]
MIFTTNISDWMHHLDRRNPISTHIWTSTLLLLKILDKNFTTGTFFIERKVAKKYPILIRKIARAGHEVACYVLPQQNGKRFAYETAHTMQLLEDITGLKVIGIRSSNLTTENTSFKAYCTLLQKMGIKYDSSLLPQATLKTLAIYNPSLLAFDVFSIDEYPLPLTPHFGGDTFRRQPYFMTHYIGKSLPQNNTVFHMQAYELGLQEYNNLKDIIIIPADKKSNFWGRKSIPIKLHKLLKDFSFSSFYQHYYAENKLEYTAQR